MTPQAAWYIQQNLDQTCSVTQQPVPDQGHTWGPYESQAAAIAHRVGLIRARKCLPQQPGIGT